MKEDLKYTFNNINDWLKFAEAKNAGLLALNIACIIGLMQSEKMFSEDLNTFQGILVIMFCISSCVCIYTILPVINKGFRFYKKLDDTIFTNSKDSLNSLHYNDLAKLSSEQFVLLFKHKYGIDLTAAEKDFANQITNNAEICVQKYTLFFIGAWFSFGAFVLGILVVIGNAI